MYEPCLLMNTAQRRLSSYTVQKEVEIIFLFSVGSNVFLSIAAIFFLQVFLCGYCKIINFILMSIEVGRVWFSGVALEAI